MFLLKAVTVVVAGVLTAMAVKHVMGELEAARARVKVKRDPQGRSVTRLRQDPRTGIYYPES
jgi:hypothetical protein